MDVPIVTHTVKSSSAFEQLLHKPIWDEQNRKIDWYISVVRDGMFS